jgi:replicative DNA helicase
VIEAVGVISALPIRLDGTSVLSPMQMRSRARKWMAEYGLDLIVIDYLQLMQESEGPKRQQANRVQVIDEISRNLKMLARELNIPILLLAQLSRAVEQRQSKVPQLSDLRESGGIEQNADIVAFIYRDEMHNEDSDRQGFADLIVAKHRNGPTGQVVLRFEAKTTRFFDPGGNAPESILVPREEEIDLDLDGVPDTQDDDL